MKRKRQICRHKWRLVRVTHDGTYVYIIERCTRCYAQRIANLPMQDDEG